MPTAPYLPTQIRRLARIVRAERRVADATTAALIDLGETVRTQLAADGYTAVVVDNRAPEWRAALTDRLMPVIADVFAEGYAAESRRPAVTAAAELSPEPDPVPSGPADRYATRYLGEVHNRLVNVSDDVFRTITHSLEEGRQATFQVTGANGITSTETGESISQLAARVESLLSDEQRWRNRGVTVARTEVISANNAGSHAAAADNAALFGTGEGSVIKEWLATSDTRTRDTHQTANHQTVMGLGSPFQVGAASMQTPGDPGAPAGEVVNCVVGSTQVSWAGQVVHAATRRPYTGTFVDIVTARGHKLTATPNHPILTEDGYVPAKSLRVGQHVLATLTPPSPEVQDGPPSIEQVHRAAQQSGTTSRVRVSGVDFHGDGTDAEVQVVRPDRHLLLDGDAERIREGLQAVLVRLSDGARGLATSRRAERRAKAARVRDRQRADSRAAGLVGSSSASTALLWGHAGGGQQVRLRARPDGQTQLLDPSDDQGTADPEVTRHLQDALALGMTPCEIISVEVYAGSHDVFNLQTSDAWYVGNGIAQHNCRCTALYHYPGDPGYDELAADLGASTGLLPEDDYVARLHADLESGRLTPDQLRAASLEASDQAKVNVQAALTRHEQTVASRAPVLKAAPEPPRPIQRTGGSVAASSQPPASLLDSLALKRGGYNATQVVAPGHRSGTNKTRATTLAELRSTPEGRMLQKTLDSFQSGGSTAIPRLRTDIEKYLTGVELSPGREDAVRNLLGAIGHSDAGDAPLWRGMAIPGDVEEVLARYTVGSDMDLSLASFSADKSLAQGFTEGGAGQKVRRKSTTPVLIEWVGAGKKALPIQNLAKSRIFWDEKEWVGAGKYRVTGTKTVKRNGVQTVVVTIEQRGIW